MQQSAQHIFEELRINAILKLSQLKKQMHANDSRSWRKQKFKLKSSPFTWFFFYKRMPAKTLAGFSSLCEVACIQNGRKVLVLTKMLWAE